MWILSISLLLCEFHGNCPYYDEIDDGLARILDRNCAMECYAGDYDHRGSGALKIVEKMRNFSWKTGLEKCCPSALVRPSVRSEV